MTGSRDELPVSLTDSDLDNGDDVPSPPPAVVVPIIAPVAQPVPSAGAAVHVPVPVPVTRVLAIGTEDPGFFSADTQPIFAPVYQQEDSQVLEV